MKIFPIDINLQLKKDRLIDIFLLQWHTPLPVDGHTWKKIPHELAENKHALLINFRNWLLNYFDKKNIPSKPLFIVTPELSMPISCADLLDDIVNAIGRPTIIIAGFEYLTWDEYREIIYKVAMPQPETWLANGHIGHIVNLAGVWIRDNVGQIKKYIQPKTHPQDHEQALPVYAGQNILLFRSSEQIDGPRLNFCVRICSDFVNADFVRQLREEIAGQCPGSRLDLTFLIQCNRDQDAEQFKQGVQRYFDVADGIAPTKDGCLFFINNANKSSGKSKEWGRTKIHFPNETWRFLTFPSPTYWLTNDNPHNYQAAIMRESGPGIYWLTYKPHYLVEPIPGSGQLVPFQGNPSFASINGETFGQEPDANRFVPIPAVCHWLKAEWEEGEDDFRSYLTENNINKEVSDCSLELYRSGVNACVQVIGYHDDLARNAVNTYFIGWEKELYPFKEIEPQNWHNDVSKAIKKMMRIYTLLVAGAQALPGEAINPDFTELHHAMAANELLITFLWGGGELTPRRLIHTHMNMKESHGLGDLSFQKSLLILMNPSEHSNKNDLFENIRRDGVDIVKQSSPEDASPHLQQDGDILTIPKNDLLFVLYDSEMMEQISRAKSENDLKELTRRILGDTLS